MEFEWDSSKNKRNVLKHGIAFEETVPLFEDLKILRLPDLKHSTTTERREILIGPSAKGILLVIFTIRNLTTIRIISARKAHRKERLFYEKNSKV